MRAKNPQPTALAWLNSCSRPSPSRLSVLELSICRSRHLALQAVCRWACRFSSPRMFTCPTIVSHHRTLRDQPFPLYPAARCYDLPSPSCYTDKAAAHTSKSAWAAAPPSPCPSLM